MSGVQSFVDPLTGSVGIGTTTPSAPLHVEGNTYVGGGISANNMNPYRNRIINGDMRIDQRNLGNATGGAGNLNNGSGYGVDRFKVVNTFGAGSVVQKQTSLSQADVSATGGNFATATLLTATTQNGLIAHIPFDGASPVDIMGSLTTPQIVGSGTTYSTSQTKIGTHSLSISGNSNSATVNTATSFAQYNVSSSLSSGTGLTMCCWFYTTNISIGTYTILALSNSTSYTFTIMTSSNGNVYSDYPGGNTDTSTSFITINAWHHLCVTITFGGSATLYVNGLVKSTIQNVLTTLTPTPTIFNIGARVTKNYAIPNGFIDDVRLYNRALSAGEVALLVSATSIPTLSMLLPPTTPTMYFPFDGNLTDSSGNNYAWTSTGTMNYVTGYASSQALYLANEGNVVTTQTKASNRLSMAYNLSGSTTMTFWICVTKLPTSGNQNTIAGFGNGASSSINIYMQYLSATTANLYLYNMYLNTSAFVVTINTWYHVTAVFVPSGTSMLYVNGSLIGSSSSTIAAYGSCTLMIGDQPTTNNLPFAGYIDDFRIYNRSLSAVEVAQLYYSYTPAQYCLYQQPIEGFNIGDFGWGTSGAQPATVSAWIKNNTGNAQSFALSANTGGIIAWMPFEGNYLDQVGTVLSQPIRYGTPTFSTSIFKVGSQSIYFPNTSAGGPSSALQHTIMYTVPNTVTPKTVSFWFNLTSITSYPSMLFSFGNTADLSNNNGGFTFRIESSTVMRASFQLSGASTTIYSVTSSTIPITNNTWYHIAITYDQGSYCLMYVNGVLAASTASSIPNSPFVTYTTGLLFNTLWIGCSQNTYTYNGYIDDFRIYNRPLSAEQIAQLNTNNASNAIVTPFMLPRSIVYNTPNISAGAWQRVSFTIPVETVGYWPVDNGNTLMLSICLGSSATFATANVAAQSGSITTAWNTATMFTGSSVQLLGAAGSSTNFLSINGNNILVTGVQLEKGNLLTPFEFRPMQMELSLCQRYAERLNGSIQSGTHGDGYSRVVWQFKVQKRSTPTILLDIGSASGMLVELGTDVVTYYKSSANSYIIGGTIALAEL